MEELEWSLICLDLLRCRRLAKRIWYVTRTPPHSPIPPPTQQGTSLTTFPSMHNNVNACQALEGEYEH